MFQETAQSNFDLIVIGGGIHGLMVATLAAEKGQNALLIEKGAMGSAVSSAWFGILHGGLRYLQNLELLRYRESLRDRRWFMQNVPEHVSIMPFLLPLYGKGLKRASVFRLALQIDALMSWDRNRATLPVLTLPKGRVIDPNDTKTAFPMVRPEGLEGAGLWHEAVSVDLAGLFAALVDQAKAKGVTIIAHCEATELLVQNGKAVGVACAKAAQQQFFAPTVINSTGPWVETLAARFDPKYRPQHGLSLAFNLVLNRPAPSSCAVSVTPPGPDRDMMFLYPLDDKTCFAGTGYTPLQGDLGSLKLPSNTLTDFIDAINAAIPGYNLTPGEVSFQTCGVLPTKNINSTALLERGRIVDHGLDQGPKGLFTQIGTKFTTARSAAARALSIAGP